MSKEFKFLTNLRHREIQAPDWLFDTIKQRIVLEREIEFNTELKKLSNFTQTPPNNLELLIKNNLAAKKLIHIKEPPSPLIVVSVIIPT